MLYPENEQIIKILVNYDNNFVTIFIIQIFKLNESKENFNENVRFIQRSFGFYRNTVYYAVFNCHWWLL